jgi:predicted O-methyltransferase YrrM
MLASVPSLAAARDPSARDVARALRTTAFNRVSPDEQAWIKSIESRRRLLLADAAVTQPVYDPWPAGPKGDLKVLYEPVSVNLASELMSLPGAWCLLLMRIVRELRPRRCLELGTAFGISTAYQTAGLELNGAGKLTTLEGAGDWAAIAERSFDDLGLKRVEVVVGPIEETFTDVVRHGPFDYAFVDAEHTGEAILGYFDTMLPHLTAGAVVAIDDVDWSEDAWSAWGSIASHERVSAAAGIGRMGIAVIAAP